MSTPITVLVIDDDPLVCSALSSYLSADHGFLVLATGRDGLEAVTLAQKHDPDVAIIDIQMPRLDGIAATAKIRKKHPRTRVLLLTVLLEEAKVHEGIENGASGYLLKGSAPEAIRDAVQAVHHGAAVLSENLLGMISSNARHAPEEAHLYDELTSRERDVLKQLCGGLRTRRSRPVCTCRSRRSRPISRGS
ncbi:MAG: response regulator transcription factor [Propionibacteriaceae bacterium]|nr:response regulator transcription factor [Propionibacteriaceae bacterium]